MYVAKIGYAEGKCSKCGKTLRRRRPADYAVCDCYLYCPLCRKKMQPYTPDLTPTTYGPIISDTEASDLNNPMEILYYCSDCQYYSAQHPIEVALG